MNRKFVIAVSYMLIFVGLVGIIYAGYWMYSNTVSMTVAGYVLMLESSYADQNVTMYHIVTFTATLTRSGVPVQGATVELLKNAAFIAGNTTLADGKCAFQYNVTDAEGSLLQFQARYWVP